MNIGIMGAMLDEVKHIKALMNITDNKTIAERTYYTGSLNDIDTTLVFSRWGKVAAATTATTLINTFNADFIIFTGVAGAVSPKLNIGDIVIGDALYQHDMDASPFFEKFAIPLTDRILLKPEPQHIEMATKAAQKFVNNIKTAISESLLQQFNIDIPKVYKGIIASGDQFVANPLAHEDLFPKSLGEVLAVEMEGAAVAQVCQEHDIPFIIIRTISDKADHSAAIDFQNFVTNVASLYSAEIVKELVRLITFVVS